MTKAVRWYKGGPGPAADAFLVRPAYVWELLEASLRVDERVLKTVVFIGAENERGFTPYGTATLGYTEYEGFTTVILVTCAHVVEQIPGEIISVRVNRKDGTSEVREYLKSNFLYFTDKSIDLCGAPISIDPTIGNYILDNG